MIDGAPTRYKLVHTATIAIVIVVLYGIVFTTPMLQHISVGLDTVQKLMVEHEPLEHEEPNLTVGKLSNKLPQINSKNDDYVAPIWSCSDTDRKKKLVFSHIFKTAGSSMRSLLRSYAHKCNAGYVTVINCGAVRLESLHSGNNWDKDFKYRKGEHGTECKLKDVIFRNNTEIYLGGHVGPMNTSYLQEANVDILSGHVAVGIDEDWKNDRGEHVDVQYLTFFRESTHKFVSAVLYLRPKLTFDEAVAYVKESAKKRVERGDYLSDIANIMTPVQRADLKKKNVTLSPEESAELMIRNLKEKNILVGIVERMSESLEMLQHVVDKDAELDSLFESYGKIPPGASKAKEIKANKSRLSSSEVLAEVEKDEEFMKTVMNEFVKWDTKVYQYALDLHNRQYAAYQQRNPTRTFETARKDDSLVVTKDRGNETVVESVSSLTKVETESKDRVEITESAAPSSSLEPDSSSSAPNQKGKELAISNHDDDFYPKIEPIWSCSDKDRKTKLSFVHIFKTAGSSTRWLLREYAQRCSAGLAIIINCAPVNPRTIETGNWMKKEKYRSHKLGSACKLKGSIFRNGAVAEYGGQGRDLPTINTTYLEKSNIDILGGHITMGVDQYWKDVEGNHVDMQYLSFFRECTRKVVSAVVFMNPKVSFEKAVDLVKSRVRRALSKGEYLDNSNYILTPAQAAQYENTTLTPENKVRLVIQNMKENKFLFGIVERMSESLEMLQYIVDKDRELDSMFESFGMILPGKNKTKEIVMNKSKLSSSDVLAEVEKDEEFMKDFREYVKFEAKVYEFALKMHMRQYEAFQRQTENRAHSPDPPVERIETVPVDATHAKVVIDKAPVVDDYSGKIDPMWSCKDSDRKRKLVFVHVFKTAGSSMRKLLRKYAETCHAGLSIAIRCAPVLPESIRTGNWIRDGRERATCQLSQTIYRNSTNDQRARPMNTTVLEETNTDILGGHITLGTERDWKDHKGDHVDVQYFTFLRDGKHKYISGLLYMHPKFTFDEAVARTKVSVMEKVKRGEYLDTSGYLITPTQREELGNVTLTVEQAANLVMNNLKENNVLVGIVERMSESLEMLQRVIDKDGELDTMFERFGKVPAGASNTTKVFKANKSRISTEEVMAEIEKDVEFMKVFREFTKYYDKIYHFGLQMHLRQYESAFQDSKTVAQ